MRVLGPAALSDGQKLRRTRDEHHAPALRERPAERPITGEVLAAGSPALAVGCTSSVNS